MRCARAGSPSTLPSDASATLDPTPHWEHVAGRQFQRVSTWQCASALFALQREFAITPVTVLVHVAGGVFGGLVFLQLEYAQDDFRQWLSATALMVNLAVLFINVKYGFKFYEVSECSVNRGSSG